MGLKVWGLFVAGASWESECLGLGLDLRGAEPCVSGVLEGLPCFHGGVEGSGSGIKGGQLALKFSNQSIFHVP